MKNCMYNFKSIKIIKIQKKSVTCKKWKRDKRGYLFLVPVGSKPFGTCFITAHIECQVSCDPWCAAHWKGSDQEGAARRRKATWWNDGGRAAQSSQRVWRAWERSSLWKTQRCQSYTATDHWQWTDQTPGGGKEGSRN